MREQSEDCERVITTTMKKAVPRGTATEKPEKADSQSELTIREDLITLNQASLNGQAKKSIRRMPWHWEPKKDVTSCEKLR